MSPGVFPHVSSSQLVKDVVGDHVGGEGGGGQEGGGHGGRGAGERMLLDLLVVQRRMAHRLQCHLPSRLQQHGPAAAAVDH